MYINYWTARFPLPWATYFPRERSVAEIVVQNYPSQIVGAIIHICLPFCYLRSRPNPPDLPSPLSPCFLHAKEVVGKALELTLYSVCRADAPTWKNDFVCLHCRWNTWLNSKKMFAFYQDSSLECRWTRGPSPTGQNYISGSSSFVCFFVRRRFAASSKGSKTCGGAGGRKGKMSENQSFFHSNCVRLGWGTPWRPIMSKRNHRDTL